MKFLYLITHFRAYKKLKYSVLRLDLLERKMLPTLYSQHFINRKLLDRKTFTS